MISNVICPTLKGELTSRLHNIFCLNNFVLIKSMKKLKSYNFYKLKIFFKFYGINKIKKFLQIGSDWKISFFNQCYFSFKSPFLRLKG